MGALLLIAVVTVFAVLIYFALWAGRKKPPSPPAKTIIPARIDPPRIIEKSFVPVTFDRIQKQHPTTTSDFRFERWLRNSPLYDKWFYSKIAGVSHKNADGSSRQEILLRCDPPESLHLVLESDNPVDPKAVALHRLNGEQLGYLNSDLAHDMFERTAKGEVWGVVLKDVNLGHTIIGANIAIIRFKSDKPKKRRKPKTGE